MKVKLFQKTRTHQGLVSARGSAIDSTSVQNHLVIKRSRFDMIWIFLELVHAFSFVGAREVSSSSSLDRL